MVIQVRQCRASHMSRCQWSCRSRNSHAQQFDGTTVQYHDRTLVVDRSTFGVACARYSKKTPTIVVLTHISLFLLHTEGMRAAESLTKKHLRRVLCAQRMFKRAVGGTTRRTVRTLAAAAAPMLHHSSPFHAQQPQQQ